jgi:hypothetical protein
MKVYEITISFKNDLAGGLFDVTTQTQTGVNSSDAKDKALQNFEDEWGSSAYDIAVISIIEIGGSF